jgi:hypothetical protein
MAHWSCASHLRIASRFVAGLDWFRDIGLARRKSLLFGEFEELQSGTTQLFNLFTTFPWHIHKHSSLLALHFTTIGLILILLVAYSLVAAIPLISTIRANNYQQQYVVKGENGKEGPTLCDKVVKVCCVPLPQSSAVSMELPDVWPNSGFMWKGAPQAVQQHP